MSDSDGEQISSEVSVPTQKKKTIYDHFLTFNEVKDKLLTLQSEFNEKELEFEQERKEYNIAHKKLIKEYNSTFNRFSSKYIIEQNKKLAKKSNKRGGFTNAKPVPAKLRKYLGLEEDEEKTRPEITSLLSKKFKADGFKQEGGKTVISSKKIAKQLGVQKDFEIEFKSLQTFIKKFYDEEKELLSNITDI